MAGESATERLFRQVREETPPSGAMVLSDASGRWFHWRCQLCEGKRGQAAKDRKLIQARADAHNAERHGR